MTDNAEIMSRIVVKAWTDPKYVELLKSDPKRALEEEGFDFCGENRIEVEFLFDTKEKKTIVIPSPPENLSLDVEELKSIAAQVLAIQLELF